MQALNCFIYLLLHFIVISSQSCETQVYTGFCKFHVQSIDSSCTNFEFQYCQYSTNYEKTSEFYSDCARECCDNYSAPKTYRQLSGCYQGYKRFVITLIVIFGGGPLLIIIICLACKFKESLQRCWQRMGTRFVDGYAHCCQCFKKSKNKSEVKKRQYEIKEQIISQEIIKRKEEWVHRKEKSDNMDKNCAICLEENGRVKLNCGHYNHKICIFDWISKNNSCPNCDEKIKQVTLHCRRCQEKQIIFSIKGKEKQIFAHSEICESCAQIIG